MIEITEKTYVIGYWFASMANNDCWYVLAIKDSDKYRWQYTFRYSKDDDPHSGKDEKHIRYFELDIKEMSEDEFISKMNLLFKFIKLEYNFFDDHFLVQSDGNKFMEIAKTKDYMHMRQVTSEEEKEIFKKEEN